MSVQVPNNMPVDHALKLLWRECIREGIPDVFKKVQYMVKPNQKRHEIKKEYKKRKVRRRRARRKLRRKGQLRIFI